MPPRLPVLAALAALLVGSVGHAAGEEEWQLSGALGGATVSVDGRTPLGPTAALDLQYGWDDAWAARLSATGSLHSVSADETSGLPGGRVRALAVIAGVSYTFDVLRLVPYVDVGAGAMTLVGAVQQPGTTLAIDLGFGADFWVTRQWAVGGLIRYMFTPIEVLAAPDQLGGTPFFFTVAARVSWLRG